MSTICVYFITKNEKLMNWIKRWKM